MDIERRSWSFALLLLGACLSPAEEGTTFDPAEFYAGGEAGTNTLLMGSNAFKLPMPGLTSEHESQFYSGNSWFNQAFVSAPASTATRDGLGPVFNATGCSACHFNDGRAAPPEDGRGPFVGLLIRLSDADGGPDPVYGGQLQDIAIDGVVADGLAQVTTEAVSGTFDDGEPYTLMRPSYTFDLLHGPFAEGGTFSPRVAPHMIGLGLIEAIPQAAIEAGADPDDADGDGISGVAQRADGTLGRFGWKADSSTVELQTAHALNGDLGLTTSIFPVDDCTRPDCLAAPSGGDPEVEAHVFDRIVLYSRGLAVPARRMADDPTVRSGKAVFHDLGCAGCHTPSWETGDFPPLPELAGQKVWPYTDLLLHDMGPDLADGRPLGEASGSMWKTPPLWGLGLVPQVSGHSRYLHDGRARDLTEAVLWHGGEAAAARDAFRATSAEDRAALLRFLEDL